MGGADPGSAEPDDPMAHARHGMASFVAFQRRPDHPDQIMSSANTGRKLREASQDRPGRQGHRARSRAGGAVILRRNWPAVALVAAGLALRVLAQFAYRPAIFYIDTPRYLLNEAPGMDPLGYKAVLRAITAVANLDAVIIVQHLLGLAMAVVIYVLLRRRGTGRWLAALAIAPVLLDAYQVQIEQTLMPDVWFEAMIVAGAAAFIRGPRMQRAYSCLDRLVAAD